MTSPVDAESLSKISSLGGSKLHITLRINASAITFAALDLIGTANIKLVIVHPKDRPVSPLTARVTLSNLAFLPYIV